VRQIGRLKMGYFPLSLAEAGRIRGFLLYPAGPFVALDPCVGDGAAFVATTSDSTAVRYGIELDAYRAEQARRQVDELIQGDCLAVHCPVGSLSLLYLNPPYDFECGEERNQRMEQVFLTHTYRWLKVRGVLVLVVPGDRLGSCSEILASHFKDKRIYRLTEAECVRYKQVVVFGVRRTHRERQQLRDGDVSQARARLFHLARNYETLPALPNQPDWQYPVPESGPAQFAYRGLPLDAIEDLLPNSSAYRQVARILFARETRVSGRPLTPLHGGHVGLLSTAGMLNGLFGQDDSRHLACWESVKVVDHSEEEEDDGTVTIRERERFTHHLTLVFRDGRTAILGDKEAGHEERTPTNERGKIHEACEGHPRRYHGPNGSNDRGAHDARA